MIALQNEKPMQQETQTARQREQASLMFTSHLGHKQTTPCEMTSSFMEGSILKPVVGQRIIFFLGEKYDIWLLFQPLWCWTGQWLE